MSFLMPFFLVGGLAIAGPIIFHLIRRSPKLRQKFSSLMFLKESPPKVSKRKKLDNILLLLLRAAIVGLLAIAFARPFLKLPIENENRANPRVIKVLLVDRSASTRQGDVWDQIVEQVEDTIRSSESTDSLALLTFDQQTTTVMDLTQWDETDPEQREEIMIQKLAAVEPGWASTRLDNAFIVGSEVYEEAVMQMDEKQNAIQGQVIVFSDFQEGADVEQLNGYEWPDNLDFVIKTVRLPPTGNAGVQFLSDNTSTGETFEGQRVRVVNTTDSPVNQFDLTWAGVNGIFYPTNRMTVYVPPGQSRVALIPDTEITEVALEGDGNPFDNRAWKIRNEKTAVPVVYVGTDSPSDTRESLYFLGTALGEKVSLIQRALFSEITPEDLEKSEVIIATDISSVEDAERARSIIESGKTVLFALKENFSSDILAALLGLDSIKIDETFVRNYALFGQIDFSHPIFNAFADPRYSDFTKIHFWKHRRIPVNDIENARVLARFDNKEPAIIEAPIGSGSLVLLTSGWKRSDSELARSTKFVIMLFSLLEYSGAIEEQVTSYRVGDSVLLSGKAETAEGTVRMPDGTLLDAKVGDSLSATDAPGIFVFETADSSQSFAVNLDPLESHTGKMDLDNLADLGLPVGVSGQSADEEEIIHKAQLLNTELESRQKLWRWILLFVVILLVVESWLAGRLVKRSSVRLEQAT